MSERFDFTQYKTLVQIQKRIGELNKLIPASSKQDRKRLVSERTELCKYRAERFPKQFYPRKKRAASKTNYVVVKSPVQGGSPGLGKRS